MIVVYVCLFVWLVGWLVVYGYVCLSCCNGYWKALNRRFSGTISRSLKQRVHFTNSQVCRWGFDLFDKSQYLNCLCRYLVYLCQHLVDRCLNLVYVCVDLINVCLTLIYLFQALVYLCLSLVYLCLNLGFLCPNLLWAQQAQRKGGPDSGNVYPPQGIPRVYPGSPQGKHRHVCFCADLYGFNIYSQKSWFKELFKNDWCSIVV